MTKQVFYSRHDGGLTLFKDGKQHLVANTHPNFSQILDALKAKDYDKVARLMSIKDTINATGVSKKLPGRRIFVEKGRVYYIDSHKAQRELHGTLVDRLLSDLSRTDYTKYADALLLFLDNMMKNPVKDIRQELYEWLMSGHSPITYDGCFLAYKKVCNDYFDIHSHTVEYKPGKIVRMPQDKVDRNRQNHCSVGLHFCSRGYLDHFASSGRDRVLIVKINPRHVFAIPTDYSFQKGRASEMYVVGEYTGNQKEEAFKHSFIDEDTKKVVAPDVVFRGSLRASLETIGESYGLVNDGKVLIVERREKYIPVVPQTTKGGGTKYVDVLGTPVDGEPTTMSFKTKSVRDAVKNAVRLAERDAGFGKS